MDTAAVTSALFGAAALVAVIAGSVALAAYLRGKSGAVGSEPTQEPRCGRRGHVGEESEVGRQYGWDNPGFAHPFRAHSSYASDRQITRVWVRCGACGQPSYKDHNGWLPQPDGGIPQAVRKGGGG